MTSTGSLELKTTINNGLPWKMVARGTRSSTRHAKKHVARPAASCMEAQKESESKKHLGVSVLGQHFAERAEHVPIKKRRFMIPAPSPLDRSSTRCESSQHRADIDHGLPVSRLNPNLMGGKMAEVSDDAIDCCNHDFSGIKILAEVACSSVINSDISVVDDMSVEFVQHQDALTISTHVEGNDSSTGANDISRNETTMGSSETFEDDKSEIIVPQKVLVDTLAKASGADQSEDHSMVAAQNISDAISNESSTERPKENTEAGYSENLATQRETVTMSCNLSGDEHTEKGKNYECLTDDRLHWDLNLPTDAWAQPCDVVDEVSRKYSDGEVTESVIASMGVDGSKDYTGGVIESDVHMSYSSFSAGPKAEASGGNEKECQSGYDSQFEDGELRETYPWEEDDGDSGDVEQLDYGSEPENERFYTLAESNENKLEDVEKGVLAETKCGAVKCESCNVHDGSIEKNIVVCMNDPHLKGSSPSRSFGSKASHETFPRRRPYEELDERDGGPNKFVERDRTWMRMRSRSPGKRQLDGFDSERRFTPPKGGQYGFRRPRPKTFGKGQVMMNGFDQPGPVAGPHGYVRRQFSNGGYHGRFRRFSDGNESCDYRGGGNGSRDYRGGGNGSHDFRGVGRSVPPECANDYPGRVHNNRMNGRGERSNSPPVFRRLHDPQSRSRSRSRSPVSWNRRNRSGFRANDNRMERGRLQFPKRFLINEEIGFMSPQRNQRDSRFFDGRNNGGDGQIHHDNLRRRRSPPGRMFRQEQRFDNTRKVNSENYNNLRPFVRHNNSNSRRFGDGGGSRVGGCRYEEEKNGNRYEMVHRPQPLRLEAMEEDGDNIRRFRLDAEQHSVVSIDNNNNEAS